MAYFVAKELNLRPLDILTKWNCEELLVAYGYYANIHSYENYAMYSPKDRAQHRDAEGRPAPITWLDRWAVLFVTPEQMKELAEDTKDRNNQDELSRAASIFFG